MNFKTKVANKIKLQIAKFSGIISKGFSKPKDRLIKELIYGIQADEAISG